MQNGIEQQQAIEIERRLHRNALAAMEIGADLVAIAALETADALMGGAGEVSRNRRVLTLMGQGRREEAVTVLRSL